MSDNVFAVIGTSGSGIELFMEQMAVCLKQPMDIVTAKEDGRRGYELFVWNKPFLNAKAEVYTVDEDFSISLDAEHKRWAGIILLIDGAVLDVEAEDQEEYIYKVSRRLREMGQLEVLNAFAQVDRSWKLPPVSISFTKVDYSERTWADANVYKETLYEILRQKYMQFFNETFGQKELVSMTNVSKQNDMHSLVFFGIYSVLIQVILQKRKEWITLLKEYQELHVPFFKSKAIKQRIEELEELQAPLHTDAYYLEKGLRAMLDSWDDDSLGYNNNWKTTAKGMLGALAEYYSYYSWEFSKEKQDHWNDMITD